MSATQILVVEDEKLVATAIQYELEQFGYQVSGIASSSKDAIEKAGRHRPDLVLMDIHLQGESDGIETARCIYDRFQIPVVYLSAFSDPETVARASETNAYGFLLKPYEEQELQTTIEMAVAKRRAEAKLEETERWLAAIHNGIDDAVIAVDPEQRIRFLNPAAAALTGWPIDEAIGMPIETVCNLVSSTGRIVIENVANKVTATSRPSELPEGCWVVSKHDHETPVEGSVLAIRDSRGDLLGTVVSFRDISSRLELNRLRRQAEEKRRHAEKMESVSRLAGGLADHLNNLMTVILGNTSLSLTQTPEETETSGLMRQVEVAAQRAAALVQRLMLFSTLSGRIREAPSEVDLNRFIPSCLKDVNLRLDPEIALSYKPDPNLWHVAADDLQLGSVVYELALNSQEAMPEGGRISLQAENISLSEADLAAHPVGHVGEFVRLKINDTGTGMSPAVRAHVFEPCFTTKPGGSAAGLGLSLIAAIVEQQHGWIECQSQLRHGTQFEIYLPRYRSESHAKSAGSQPQKPRSATPTILLAEPDPMVRDLGRRILEAEGFRVLLAEDGVQAVNIFQQESHQIDLAILDLNIPKLTPYAVLERLVELDPHVRVLFSGGYFTEDLTNTDGHTMGIVTKPYHHDELIEMVRHSLARHAKEN